ncbi:MAG: NAD-dependent epimerase/dehydratase family protein, partial [Patescibacteria group bacterium]
AGSAKHIHSDARLIVADVRNVTELIPHFQGADTVFHLAALPRVQRSIEDPVGTGMVNINGTMNALIAAQMAGVQRFIFASSSSVYGNPTNLPAHEGLPLNPLSPYAMHKSVGESLCRIWSQIYGLKTMCLRFFNVYGPRFDPSGPYALVIGKFLTQRLAGEPLTVCGDGEQSRDFTHVSDVVRACVGALSMPDELSDGIAINIGGGNPTSINRIAELISGRYRNITYLPAREGEPRHTHADIKKAARVLGWKPNISIESGIAQLKAEMGIQG